MGSEHRFYKSNLSAHVILVCCVIFNLPCCNDAGVMEPGHIWELRGKQSWDQFYNHHPENPTHPVPLDLLLSHELLSTSLKPCSNLLLHLSLQNRKGKFLQPHSRAHPAAAGHHTLQGCAHFMVPLNPSLSWSETENGSPTFSSFSLLKTIVSKYSAGKVMLVKQCLPDGKPLKYLPFFKEKIILRNCPWVVSLDL